MTNANDPLHPLSWTSRPDGVPELNTLNKGLTKREYFAAMSLQGLLAHGWNVHEYKDSAIHATKAADALINALNETK
jgi:hypothetical protein